MSRRELRHTVGADIRACHRQLTRALSRSTEAAADIERLSREPLIVEPHARRRPQLTLQIDRLAGLQIVDAFLDSDRQGAFRLGQGNVLTHRTREIADILEALIEAIDQLEEKTRRAFLLVAIDGKSVRDVACELATSEDVCRRWLRDAVAQIRLRVLTAT